MSITYSKFLSALGREVWFEIVPSGAVGATTHGRPPNAPTIACGRDGNDLFLWFGRSASLTVSKV